MYIGNIMLIVLNIPLVGIFVSLLRIPFRILFPVILLICLVGTYSVNSSVFELSVLLVFGILGYFIRKIQYDMAPLILAMIIGPTMELSLRQALMRSDGSFLIFLESPITMTLISLSVLLLCWNIYRGLRPKKASWEKALEEGT
jgi:putative tricarboxylic transport membrane protein